jgi:hypothetical protein
LTELSADLSAVRTVPNRHFSRAQPTMSEEMERRQGDVMPRKKTTTDDTKNEKEHQAKSTGTGGRKTGSGGGRARGGGQPGGGQTGGQGG